MSFGQIGAVEALEQARNQAIVVAIEAAVEVRRRYQFFLWTQGMQTLLPHKVVICGVYERSQKQLRLEVFNSILLPQPVQDLMTDGQSPLMQHVVTAWVNHGNRPLTLSLPNMTNRAVAASSAALMAVGFNELLVHGVARPERASEIETIFVFATPGAEVTLDEVKHVNLLLPHLHSAYLRVQSVERELGVRTVVAPRPSSSGYVRASISSREQQVLCWVREGMSNQEIGAQLGISPLTVKNHIQKILRKLGASNRAQAVACAMSMNLLLRQTGEVESADA